MVLLDIDSQVILSVVAFIAIPVGIGIWKLSTKIDRLCTQVSDIKEDVSQHRVEYQVERDKIVILSEKSALHSLLIQRIENDLKEVKSYTINKKSPV